VYSETKKRKYKEVKEVIIKEEAKDSGIGNKTKAKYSRKTLLDFGASLYVTLFSCFSRN